MTYTYRSIMENPMQEILQEGTAHENQNYNIEIRTPKKVLHFCDGVIEEFSGDESDSDEPAPTETQIIDTTALEWVPWMKHYMWTGGYKAVEYCDYMGEGLANFLGITTPKYQLEINEHERQEAEKEKIAAETAGWMTSNGTNGATPLVVSQPMAIGDDPAPV